MRDRPTELDERDLLAACREGWAVDVVESEYLPVGAGSYHWSVTDRRGAVWFVKVDDIGRDAGYGPLERSFETALALRRDAGLDFVLAPVPDGDGAVLRTLSSRYALSVFPMIAGSAGHFGPHRREHLAEMAVLLARLHLATPVVAHLAPRADLRLPGRERLHEALRDLDRPWTAGPHAEPARRLLATHAARVQRWLSTFDRLVGEVGEAGEPMVVTHGEPHPGNVMWTADGARLIDWGTVQLAPPERDLWMLTSAFTGLIGEGETGGDEEVLARYTEAGGGPVTPAGVALYRQWWALADVAAFTDDLRRPHGDGEDAAAALTYLAGYLESATD
jgi:spectinomycin phosphotransferase